MHSFYFIKLTVFTKINTWIHFLPFRFDSLRYKWLFLYLQRNYRIAMTYNKQLRLIDSFYNNRKSEVYAWFDLNRQTPKGMQNNQS